MIQTLELYGKAFDVVKKSKKQWQTEYNNAIASKGDSRQEAIDNLKAKNKDDLLKACDSHDETVKRDIYFKEHTEEFTKIFGFTPPRDFLLYAFGCGLSLDVIALDKKLRTPDGISTNDYIQQTYGNHALTIVTGMI